MRRISLPLAIQRDVSDVFTKATTQAHNDSFNLVAL